MEPDEVRNGEAERAKLTAELLSELERELKQTSVAEHVRRMLASLSTLAVQRLGVGEADKELRDLGQAHLAIECFRVLSEALVAAGIDEEADAYREVLSQMQLAFVAELNRPDVSSEAVGQDTPESNSREQNASETEGGEAQP